MSKMNHLGSSSRRFAILRPGRLLATGTLCLLGILFLIPVTWMLSLSLQTHQETLRSPLTILPHTLQWGNYLEAFKAVPLLLYLQNTLTITIATTFGATFASALSAYALARFRFPGRGLVFAAIIATMMLPPAVTLIPLYIIFRDLHWLNTVLPLTVPIYFGGGAFNIFLMRQFILTIPRELDEAALIDGANRWQIFIRVILPLSKPALTVVAVTTAAASWNDFLGPLIYLNTPDRFTLAVGLANFSQATDIYGTAQQTELLMAATVMMVAPIVLLFIIAQRSIIQGFVTTGLKI